MNQIPEHRRLSGPAWLLRSLEPLLIEPAGAHGTSHWWRHAPFANWVLARAGPKQVASEGEAFQGLQELALMAGQATEWGGAAAGAPVELLVLDGSWAEGETRAVLAHWRPRLAPGAAVLVHGINPGQGGSLLWRDLSREHPRALRFELPGGAGLGLLIPEIAGSSAALRDLCTLPPEAAEDFKALCAALGARWSAGQQVAAMRQETGELRRSLTAARQRNEEMRRRIDLLQQDQEAALAVWRAAVAAEHAALAAEREARRAEREQLMAEMRAAAQRLTAAHAAEILRRSAEAETMRRQTAEAHAAALAALAARAEAAARERAKLHAKAIARLWARARAAEGALAEIASSTSWRVTRRIIRAASWLPRSWRVAGRRALRLAWWSATGRLFARLRQRRRTQRSLALLRASPLFDPVWYARAYPDVALSGLDPTAHFAAHGAAENRDAGPAFDSAWYRRRYSDVATARVHPLLHFLQHGAAEGREWRAVVPTPSAPKPREVAAPADPATPEAAVVQATPEGDGPASAALPEEPAVLLVPADARIEPAPSLAEESADYVIEPKPSSVESPVGFPDAAIPEEAPAPTEAKEAATLFPRLELLGRDLPEITIFPVTVGFVVGRTALGDLRRVLESAETALEAIGQRRPGSILLADDSGTADPAELAPWAVASLRPGAAHSFAAAHNRMMERAFAAGSEVYVVAHPGGAFDTETLIALIRMMRANGWRALVEAARRPREVPRPIDPECYAVPWSSGACLAIPRRIHEALGGFDERLEPWGADVDFSWRAKAAGFDLLACPDALFALPFSDEEDAISPSVLASAFLLATKWGLSVLEAELAARIERTGGRLPDLAIEMVSDSMRAAADLGTGPFFGDRVW
jgi:hypothetical protein